MDCPCQGKNLDKLLQPLILCILARGSDMHGFAILKEIGKIPRFEDKNPDATGVYRYLKKMESSGLLTSRWELDELDDAGKPKRVFSITEKGRSCMFNWAEALTDYEKHIHYLVDMIREQA